MSEPPIIDTHQHLWDLTEIALPWQQQAGLETLRKSFIMSDYLKATDGLPITKTVYMEVNVPPEQQRKEAEFVIDLCRRDDNPMSAAVIGGSPQSAEFADYIEPLTAFPEVKGVRTVLHDPDRPAGMCLERRFLENIQRLGELGLSFDLCMRPSELADGAQLAEACPQTRFVVDHCGNMPVTGGDEPLRTAWRQGMRQLAELDNTVCKISGIVVTATKDEWTPADLEPIVNFCLETFGPERVFFGGDWPVCTLNATLHQWVEALCWIVRNRSSEFRGKLFYENAAKFYGLE